MSALCSPPQPCLCTLCTVASKLSNQLPQYTRCTGMAAAGYITSLLSSSLSGRPVCFGGALCCVHDLSGEVVCSKLPCSLCPPARHLHGRYTVQPRPANQGPAVCPAALPNTSEAAINAPAPANTSGVATIASAPSPAPAMISTSPAANLTVMAPAPGVATSLLPAPVQTSTYSRVS